MFSCGFDKAKLTCQPRIGGGHKNFWYDLTDREAEAIESQALIRARSGAGTWWIRLYVWPSRTKLGTAKTEKAVTALAQEDEVEKKEKRANKEKLSAMLSAKLE